MNFKKLGLMLSALVMVSAIFSGNAFAEKEFKEAGSAWYTRVEGKEAKLGEGVASGKKVTTSAASKIVLQSEIAGKKLDVTATGVECVGECILYDEGTNATATGILKFTGVNVSEPAGCSTSASFETKKLHGLVGMRGPSVATIELKPETGTTLATIELSGPECSVAGSYKLSGIIYSEVAVVTGTYSTSETYKLSKVIQESAGSAGALKLGTAAAFLTGELKNTASVEYAMKEK